MSIRYTAPAMLIIVFVLNIVILLLFFQFYVTPYIKNGIHTEQQNAEQLITQISEHMDGRSIESGRNRLHKLTEENPQITFVLEDVEAKKHFTIPDGAATGSEASAAMSISMSGRMYILFIYINTGIIRSVEEIGYQVTRLELILFSITFFITSAFIHYHYLKPLLHLKDEVNHFQKRGSVITLSKRGDELGQLQNSFHRMAHDLAAEKAKQNRIIASISHDIKTPLTSLMGFSERLLTKNVSKEKQNAYLERIYTQSKNIEAIVNEFDEYLSYSLDSHLHLKDTETSFVCAMLEDEYREVLSDIGVRFEVVNRCGELSSALMDMAKMRRVFANIIGNTLRHNPPEGLAISVWTREDEDAVIFTIQDNGKGVSESDLAHIFEPFYTSDNSRKISGLGLSICGQIMTKHDGSIYAVNTGRGLAVTLRIPKPKAMI